MSYSNRVDEKSDLSPNEALVLQQVLVVGTDDIRSVSSELGLTRQTTINTALDLEEKGLIDMRNDFDGLWMRVSKQGKDALQKLLPGAQDNIYLKIDYTWNI